MSDSPISDQKAIVFGVGVTLVLSATMVVAGLKAGITPGASTLVVLTAWAAFSKSVKGPGGRRFLNLAQVAGSSGMACVSGVIFTAPLLQVLHLNFAQIAVNDAYNVTALVNQPEFDLRKVVWATRGQELLEGSGYADTFPGVNPLFMMLFTCAGALVGFGFVGISTKKFLSDPTLPAPEAHACSTMVTASCASEADQPDMTKSLVLSTGWSFGMPLLTTLGFMTPYMDLFKRTYGSGNASRVFAITMPCSPVYIGIGGLLTLSTAIVTVMGAFTRLTGDFWVAQLTGEAAVSFPDTTMRWIGGGAMTVGVAFSLVKFMSPRVAGDGDNGDVKLLEIPQQMMVMLYGSIAGGVLLLATGILINDSADFVYAGVMILTIFIMASLMVTLGAILSLQIGSSASPVSGTVFVTTLVICLVSLGYRTLRGSAISPIESVTGISYMLVTGCVAVSAANDASQDYKTLQLGGIAPREGFLAQILGLIGGAFMVPLSYTLAHNAYGLGTDALPAPQGQLFAIIIEGILIDQTIPWYPVIIGLVIGCIAVSIELAASARGLMLPAMAFAVGLYLPPQLGLGILWGAGFRYLGERLHTADTGKEERTYESVLAAAGMITGAAFLDLIVGILVVGGVSPEDLDLEVVSSTGKYVTSTFGILFLGWLLYTNARFGVPEATAQPELDRGLSGLAPTSGGLAPTLLGEEEKERKKDNVVEMS